jgi:hypothetical protein
MPYAKDSSIAGAKEIYEIEHFCVDSNRKEVHVSIKKIILDENGIPKLEMLNKVIRNFDQKIIDPTWNSNSTPPKPDGFNENDPSTWGELSQTDFPRVNDPAKQFFNNLATEPMTSGTLYQNIKSNLYQTLVDMGELPPVNDGWEVL